ALRPRRWFRRQRAAQVSLEDFPQSDARRALRRDTVQRALTALPFDARVVVLLRDFVKLSYDELADVVDMAPRKLVHTLDRSRAELGAFEIAPPHPIPLPAAPEVPQPVRPEVSSVPDLLAELEREIFRDEPSQDHPTPLPPTAEPRYPMMAAPPLEIEPVEAAELV